MMKTKAGLPTTTIVIIAIVIMVIATVVIFLALPYFEDKYGDPGPCGDTGYKLVKGDYQNFYKDVEHPNRYIQHYHNDPYDTGWRYHDGYEGFESIVFDTLHDLRKATQAEYEGGTISEGSWHWFDCTAEAIS